MATTRTEFPENWQGVAMAALENARRTDPTKMVFGVNLPESWKSELTYFVRGGEVQKLLGVRAITFGGSSITTFSDPKEKKEAKPAKKAS